MKEIIRKISLPILVGLFSLFPAWARHAEGSGQQSQQQQPPKSVTAKLSLSPSSIGAGQSATLTWTTENAEEVTLEGVGKVVANGSQKVSPTQDTTYRLIAKGKGGTQEATARLTVTQTASGQTPAQQSPAKPAQPSAFTLDDSNVPPPAATAEEDAAYKASMDSKANDLPHRIQLEEQFVAKYPQSRYLESALSALTLNYFLSGNAQKMIATGDKALDLNPDDVLVLALMSRTIPLLWNSAAPNAQAQLDKAEKYAKRTIELTPTLQKPAGTSDQDFAAANNRRLSLAHSGLGVLNFQRQKFAESIPEFEAAIKLMPDSDAVNYYVMGLAEQNVKRYTDALAAFTKCSEMPGQMQGACKSRSEQAKKQAETQSSAPK